MAEPLTTMIVEGIARGHVLSDRHEQSDHVGKVVVARGNDYIAHAREKEVVLEPSVRLDDADSILAAAEKHRPDIVEVAQDDALATDVVERLRERGFVVFGPVQESARIEWDKAWSRKFMERHGIATPRFEVFIDPEAAKRYATERYAEDPDLVLFTKAGGLCGGKGALKGASLEETLENIGRMADFGDAGGEFLLEDGEEGEELSYYGVSDGETVLTTKSAQDNKRSHDGDAGEDTGGMGATAPALVTEGIEMQIEAEQITPVIRGMAAEELWYEGVLYLGAIRTPDGRLVNIEYNARWGDPEVQTILPGMTSDYIEMIQAVAEQNLRGYELTQDGLTRVCVVGASKGYPGHYETGHEITGLARAAEVSGVEIFGAAIAIEDGKFYSNGGRLFSIVGAGQDVAEARERAYEAMNYVEVAGGNLHYRTDIGHRDVARFRSSAGLMAAGDHLPVFQSIVEALAADGATPGKMFGHPCVKTPAGKVPAVYWHDSLLVKLPPADLEAWLEEPDVQTFMPVKGRPMRGWAQIPPRYVDEWEKLATQAYGYVAAS